MVHFFTTEQGNLLIRLLLAHIAADFILQTNIMVKSKNWFSLSMLLHVLVVFGLTWTLSGLWLLALIITIFHWLIDSLKISLQKKYSAREAALFAADQLLHLLIIMMAWCWHYNLLSQCYQAILFPFTNYKMSLLLLGYAWLIWPVGYLIKYALQKITTPAPAEKIERGGKLIGRFERIIILTLVLLGSYEAIGFLIAAKGIIRFGEKDKITSEYVLVGTMLSYAITIITGTLINWLLSISA